MSETIIYILVLKTILSYPSSFWGQAIITPDHLQETRIREYGLWKNQRIYVGAIQKIMQRAVKSNTRNGITY
jgi:hypothetical protein